MVSTYIQQNCNKVKQYLSIPEDNKELEAIFEETDYNLGFKISLFESMYQFIQHFEMFKEIKPFMKSVFITLKKSLEFETKSVADFEEVLIKNTIMRFIQEYITYSKISQQETVLNVLTESLGKLKLKPMIINLGLLIKPLYGDEEYVEKIEDYEEVEVTYVLNSEEEIQIKKSIDKWLETQEISLKNQELLEKGLKIKFNELINSSGLSKDSEN